MVLRGLYSALCSQPHTHALTFAQWFTLGPLASKKRVALGEMVPNGGTSLPKIFIGGEPLSGASGYSALAEAVEDGTLEGLLKKSGAKRI